MTLEEKIIGILDDQKISYEIVEHEPVYTNPAMAEALGCDPQEAAQVKASVQAHYGTEDRFDLNELAAMVQVIQDETEFAAEAYTYEGAPHAFFNASVVRYFAWSQRFQRFRNSSW